MVLAFVHFIILCSLELRVKYYTLKIEEEGNLRVYGNKRMVLFMIILLLAIYSPAITIFSLIQISEPWMFFVFPMNVSSALFGIYFCICKLYDRKHIDRFYAITVPASSTLSRNLSIVGIVLILLIFFHLLTLL